MKRLKAWLEWRKLARCETIRPDLGSGPKKGTNGWTTIDRNGLADINRDLSKGLFLKDETVDMIYSSRNFEHIPFPDLLKLIAECKRVLKKGGGSFCMRSKRKVFYRAVY